MLTSVECMEEKIQIIQNHIEKIFGKVKSWREHIHANPELSYQEYETMDFVSQQLEAIGVTYEKGVADTGVVALIKASHHTSEMPCVGLRADLDALPIHEANDVPYKSKRDGYMHACGHDVHTAILLGVAEVLHAFREKLPYPVKLIFQPGEEKNPGGASLMINDGCLKNPDVSKMYALHVFPDLPYGHVGFREGLYMASCDEIYIDINGKGGHGAVPHRAVDSILVGAEIVTSLQKIVSRNCDPTIPCVLNFGHFEGIGATNVIPEKVHIKGTFRTMNEEWRVKALNQIEQQVKWIAKANGASVDVEISKGYPFLENDPKLTQELRRKAINVLGEDCVHDLPMRLTAEDFSFYAQEIPTCFFRLGVRNEAKGIIYGVHHPRFDIEPNALKTGVLMMVLAVI